MPDSTTYQFFVSEDQLLFWARCKRGISESEPLTHKAALETLYGTTFPSVDDFMVSFSDDGDVLYCDDVDLQDGERSIEIVPVERNPEGFPDSILQVTVTDTTGDIDSAQANLAWESLLEENDQLECVLRSYQKPAFTRTTGKQLLAYLSATLIIGVIAVTITRS